MYGGVEVKSMKHIVVIYTNIIVLYLITVIAISTNTSLLMLCSVIPMISIYFYNKEHGCITE